MKPKSLSDSFVSLFRFHRAQHSNHSIALIPITLTHFPNDCVRISVFKEVVRLQGLGVVSFELRVATSECKKNHATYLATLLKNELNNGLFLYSS